MIASCDWSARFKARGASDAEMGCAGLKELFPDAATEEDGTGE